MRKLKRHDFVNLTTLLVTTLLVTACIPVRPPGVAPPVTPPATMIVHVQVMGANLPIAGAVVRLKTGLPDTWVEATTPDSGHVLLTVPASLADTQLVVTADGWVGVNRHEVVARDCTLTIQLLARPPPIPVPVQLHTQGRKFWRADGTRWDWRGLTAFRLVELVAHGREAEAVDTLRQARAAGITIVRVLAMKAWSSGQLFELLPTDGLAALPRTLDLAAEAGVYVEVVALADTALIQVDDAAQVRTIGAICATRPACLVEIANEPIHETQAPRLSDPAYLLSLRRLVPAAVLCSLGAAHGGDDANRSFTGGDYVTVHSDRADGEGGWRWVRHQRELWDIAIATGKPVVNDEPARADLAPDKHFGTGALMSLLSLGDTFHCQACIQGQFPSGAELDALTARRDGWAAPVAGWDGLYYNAGEGVGPVAAKGSDDRCLRAYSSVAGARGYTLALGVSGDPGIVWRAPWQVAPVATVGAVRLYRLAQ